MSAPLITGVRLGGSADLPLLVLGPSLGTSATTLWSEVADSLADRFHLVGWDLPGHGGNSSSPEGALSVAALANGVLAVVDQVQAERGDVGTPFVYAGDSVGGAVGQQLLLDAGDRVHAAVLLCTSPRFGEPSDWRERAALVRTAGTPVMVEPSARRWFAEGFVDRRPDVAGALLDALQQTDATGYAAVCEAIAAFDVRNRLGEIEAPLLVVSGSEDAAAPPADGLLIAAGAQHGRQVVLDEVAHLAPVEAPTEVARMLLAHLTAGQPAADGTGERGEAVRREVLGDAHVDRANAATTEFTRDFQDLITRYAWGEIWTRPGLDRRSRSMITLTALIARGHHEELAMHVRAARTNGLSTDEIKEVILQCAIYCGVPDANTAFRIAQRVLDEPADDDTGRAPHHDPVPGPNPRPTERTPDGTP